jgi:predicted enzyme related to lactoylglutathione lyase
MPNIAIKDIMSVCIYVDDFKIAYDFYSHVLGLEKSQDAGEDACFFLLNDNPMAIYLEGGYNRSDPSDRSAGVSFMMTVDSALDTYDELKEFGVRFVHEKPQMLGEGNYWFRFYDPAGNILEVVSSES